MFGGLYRRVRGALDVVQSYYSNPSDHFEGEANESDENDDNSLHVNYDSTEILRKVLLLRDASVDNYASIEASVIEALNSCLSTGTFQVNQLVDGSYTILQHAVAVKSLQLVTWLIDKGGSDVNASSSSCSPPVHLACKLGDFSICDFLLRRGASVNTTASVCYPSLHSSITTCHRFMLPRILLMGMTNSRDCGSEEKRLAIYHAVMADRADILSLFLAAPHRVWIPLYPLQRLFTEACQAGALRCADLLMRTFRVVGQLGSNSDISLLSDGVVDDAEPILRLNELDENGYSPFMYAVASSAELTQQLIDYGANVHRLSQHGETALHLLFRNLASPPTGVAERARLLLGSGLESLINQQDWEQCTALHRLVHHVNNNVRYIALTDPSNPETVLTPVVDGQQEKYQLEILDCLQLLLSHNCNPAFANWQGLTPFHALFRAFSSFLSHDVDPNFMDIHHYFYIFDMGVFARAIKLFLEAGTDPNEKPPDGQLPLKVMLHGILNISPVQYFKFRPGYLHCLQLLCQHGADCNFKLQNNQGTCITLVAALAESVLNTVGVGSYGYDRAAKEGNAQFIDDILRCLLSYGLNPNHVSKRRRSSMELAGDGSGNALAEFVNLACMIAETQDLRFLHQWIVTLLQYGADPDMEPFPAEATICHSQSSIFLRHVQTQPINQLLHLMRNARVARLSASPHSQRLLLLLYNVTSHVPVHSALQAFLTKLQRELPGAAEHTAPLIRLLSPMASNPLSLKQISRVAVYKALNRRLQRFVSALEIPKELQIYLSDVELT